MASEAPARVLGLDGVGLLTGGFDADPILFDGELTVPATIVRE